MKTLLILRHAKSSWNDSSLSDHDRPLNDRGKQDAPRVGELLKSLDLVPDAILCSTAKRARKTAKKVAAACQFDGEIQLIDELYLAPAATYLEVVQGMASTAERVMVVGHNPGLEHLLELLTQRGETLPTAALAQIRFDVASWREVGLDGGGELVGVWRPREDL
ncbi:MAG: histidine phosphatase family protein [Pirellulaceae bacterium]